MKKFLVLFILLVLPLGAYLFIIQGKINFEKLPVLTERVSDLNRLSDSKDVLLNGKISVVAFIGEDLDRVGIGVLNLNQIVYKKLFQYKEFQMVAVLPKEMESKIGDLSSELTFMVGTDLDKWKFVFGTEAEIKNLHDSMQTLNSLDADLADPFVYIVDKELNLRGREPQSSGYNMFEVSSLKNDLLDDVKVVFYEYNSALKEFNSKREI